jgi:SUMO ligase MMS21 Smc5/6 complex component
MQRTKEKEMTANELADVLDGQEPLGGRDFITKVSTMLRQQAEEIQSLKSKVQYWKGMQR